LRLEPALRFKVTSGQASLVDTSDGFRAENYFSATAGHGRVGEQVVNVILQFGAPHFSFVNLLVGGEINLLFDAIDFVVEPVIFVVETAEVRVALKAFDGVAVFREFTQYGMM
jgi:hypothetical protein